MKRHHPPTAEGVRTGSEGDALESVVQHTSSPTNEKTTEQHITLTPGVAAARPAVRERRARKTRGATHTLVLIGELDRASTHTLEAEIERLCDAGISALTLDLSKLSGIDSTGVAVIVFRHKWCGRRGCELALIAGSSAIQHAFELAGAIDRLSFKESEVRSA
jgi:anti-sigma B factor antagonist